MTDRTANNLAEPTERELLLARIIAQADFVWGLGEGGMMACSPELAGKMFDEAWSDTKSSTRQKFIHLAQVVLASRNQIFA